MTAAPLFGAVLVCATYFAGSRYGTRVGVASAAIVASTPVFLHQLVHPTMDLAAAAFSVLAVAGATSTRPRGAVSGGVAAAAAAVLRPNLLLLLFPLALFLVLRPERLWRERAAAGGRFVAAAAAGGIGVALLQNALGGSPFGLRDTSVWPLLDPGNVAPNATRYASWLSQTLTPGWVLAAAAPFLLPGALTRLFLWMFLVNVAAYLPSGVAADWSSLRFLLPTIPLMVVLAVAAIDSICRRTWSWTSRPMLFGVAAALAIFGIRTFMALLP